MKIYSCLFLSDIPYEQSHASTKPFLSMADASAEMKEDYKKRMQELEKAGYDVLKDGDYKSYLDEMGACLNYKTDNGTASMQWTICIETIRANFPVETPLGNLIVEEAVDPEHPGVYVDLAADGGNIAMALVEYCQDEADAEGPNLITRIWGDSEKEDYTDRVIHSFRGRLVEEPKVLARNHDNMQFVSVPISRLYEAGCGSYSVILNSTEKMAKIVELEDQIFYRIRTVNGLEAVLPARHLNLVHGGTLKKTENLTVQDFLPFPRTAFDGMGFGYTQGRLVGTFLTYGNLGKDNDTLEYYIPSDININMGNIWHTAKYGYGAFVREEVVRHEDHPDVIKVTVVSKLIRGLITEYASWGYPKPSCIGLSLSFRMGILDSYLIAYMKDRFSIQMPPQSQQHVESLIMLAASLGIPVKVEHGPEPIIHFDMKHDEEEDDVCRADWEGYIPEEDGFAWFRISSIEPAEKIPAPCYGVEIDEEENQYFMLPSGLVTHR